MTIIAANSVAIQNTIEPIIAYVRDSDGTPVAADNLRLTVMDRGSTVVLSPIQTQGRIQNPAVGTYVFNLGGDGAVGMGETSSPTEVLFLWQATGQPTTYSTVVIIDVATTMVLSAFQDQVDKSRKDFDDDVDNPIYLGYSTAQLIRYLSGGLNIINIAQPYPTWSSVSSFPAIQQQLLIDCAILVAIQSQELYAIDCDIDNFSNMGNVFSITHYPKLEAFANSLWARLQVQIPLMKLQYVQSGQLHIEMGPSFRLAQLLEAAPAGATIRNLYTAASNIGVVGF